MTFTWHHHEWDADRASQDRQALVLVVAKAGQLPPGNNENAGSKQPPDC